MDEFYLIKESDLIAMGFKKDEPHTLHVMDFNSNIYLFAESYSKYIGEAPFKYHKHFYKVGLAIYDKNDRNAEQASNARIVDIANLQWMIKNLNKLVIE